MRTACHGRSTEAEVREILDAAVRPARRVKLGSLLAEIGQEAGGVDLKIERDKTVTERSVTSPFTAVGVNVINPWEAGSR